MIGVQNHQAWGFPPITPEYYRSVSPSLSCSDSQCEQCVLPGTDWKEAMGLGVFSVYDSGTPRITKALALMVQGLIAEVSETLISHGAHIIHSSLSLCISSSVVSCFLQVKGE